MPLGMDTHTAYSHALQTKAISRNQSHASHASGKKVPKQDEETGNL